MTPANLFADLPGHLPAELTTVLMDTGRVRVERIVSRGHASPPGFWYDQDRDEFVLLVSGAARLLFEDDPGPVELRPGDYVTIPAHRRHRVAIRLDLERCAATSAAQPAQAPAGRRSRTPRSRTDMRRCG